MGKNVNLPNVKGYDILGESDSFTVRKALKQKFDVEI